MAFVVLGFWWVLCACSLIGVPAACGALFNVARDWQGGVSVNCTATFFRYLRRDWRQASIVGALWASPGALLSLLGLALLNFQPGGYIIMMVPVMLGLVSFLLASVFVWPLFVDLDTSSLGVVKSAYILGWAKLPVALAGAAVAGLAVIVAVVVPVLMVVSVSGAAYTDYRLCHMCLMRLRSSVAQVVQP
jgi:uncharacterized membrane protein YesL